MEPLAGITLLVLTGLMVKIVTFQYRWMTIFLWVAFAFRASLAIINCYVYALPDSQADALSFQQFAQEWARYPTMPPLPEDTSYFISWVIALLYRITGIDTLAAHALSVMAGTLTVALGSLIAFHLWKDECLARRAGWWLAMFPTLNLYSALTMREAYIWFFFSIALLGVIQWVHRPNLLALLLIVVGVTATTLYHGAMVIVGLAFLGILVFSHTILTLRLLLRNRLNLTAGFVLVVALAGLLYVFTADLSLPKIGSIYETVSAEMLIASAAYAFSGDASYPQWLLPQAPADIMLKLPVRVIYFLFSPFLWDVRSAHHTIGLLDAVLYIYFAWLFWRGRHRILNNTAAQWVTVIVATVIVTFALGTGNFGTGIRHRAKVVVPVIALSMGGIVANDSSATRCRDKLFAHARKIQSHGR
ncbi:MAG: hypothetical protein ABDI19_08335 [Armatimonadota bacterium]